MSGEANQQFHLGVFAKHWQPGTVKTRLGATIGNELAATVYHSFIVAIVRRMSSFGASRKLIVAPESSTSAFGELLQQADLPSRWGVAHQGTGDLGVRMQRFFQIEFAASSAASILIGTDSPNVPLDYFERATQLLREKPVVLGPSEDGGYYLIALAAKSSNKKIPPIFTDIDWSTGNVWSQTTNRLREHNIDFGELPVWYDVDEADDLVRLRSDLAKSNSSLDLELAQQLNEILP